MMAAVLLLVATTTTRTTTTLPAECRPRYCADGSFPREYIECPCKLYEKKVRCSVVPRAGCSAGYYVYDKKLCTIKITCPEDE